MARTYTLTDVRNHPRNPLNLSTVIRVDDSETGEIVTLTDQVFGDNLTPAKLAEIIGTIEQNVMGPRAAARAQLIAARGQAITPILPTPPTEKELAIAAYEAAISKLAYVDTLVQRKVITEQDAEYTAALQAAKDAKAALSSDKG